MSILEIKELTHTYSSNSTFVNDAVYYFQLSNGDENYPAIDSFTLKLNTANYDNYIDFKLEEAEARATCIFAILLLLAFLLCINYLP